MNYHIFVYFRKIVLNLNKYGHPFIHNSGGDIMRKNKKRTFEELVLENKKALLRDQEALSRIEERWEERMIKRLD